jgi:hypothetical protein
MARRAQRVASLGGLAAAALLLHRAGSGGLAAPPLTSPDGIGRWLDGRDGATAAMAAVRLLALGLSLYLLATTSLALLIGRRADVVTHPTLRGLVHAMAGFGLSAGAFSLALGGGSGQAAPSSDTATMQRVPDRVPGAEVMRLLPGVDVEWMYRQPADGDGQGTATLRRLDESPNPPTSVDSWHLVRGESIWSVAEQHLSDVRGRPVEDDEIDPYWRKLVEANRSTLFDPANPDLVFENQVLLLPPP